MGMFQKLVTFGTSPLAAGFFPKPFSVYHPCLSWQLLLRFKWSHNPNPLRFLSIRPDALALPELDISCIYVMIVS